jgi:hypothetical protein
MTDVSRVKLAVPTHRPEKCVQRKGDHAVRRLVQLLIPPHDLDVDVLVESPGKAVAGIGQHAPTAAIVGRIGNRVVVGRVAEPEQRKFLERAIE